VLQAELDTLGLPRPVQILGVNEVGHHGGNGGVTAGRTIPWLQDEVAYDVWTTWSPAYRDVVILGPDNTEFAVYNLTSHDLAVPANYNALRQLFIDATAL
jgi:hypothetical protein